MKLNLLKTDISLTAAFAVAALGFGFAPTAAAFSTYEAFADFELTLADVTDSSGVTVTSGWEVFAEGFGNAQFNSSSSAFADGSVILVDPGVSLGIGDTIFQSSYSYGEQTNGWAWTDAITDLDISVDNFSNQALTFTFDYIAMTGAATSVSNPLEIAEANALIFLDDLLGAVSIEVWATAVDGDPSVGSGNAIGSFSFVLGSEAFNQMTGGVDTDGFTEVIPVPAAVWLFGSGLLGLVAVARRKQAV